MPVRCLRFQDGNKYGPHVWPCRQYAPHHPFQKAAFAHDRIGQVEACELDLARMINLQFVEEPVVERTVILELERTDGVGESLD